MSSTVRFKWVGKEEELQIKGRSEKPAPIARFVGRMNRWNEIYNHVRNVREERLGIECFHQLQQSERNLERRD